MFRLGDICKVDWGNTSLTKKSYEANGEYLAVSATGVDGKISHYECEDDVCVLSAIGAQCGKMFYPQQRFTAIKNTITLTPNREKVDSKYLYFLFTHIELPKRGSAQPFISKGDIQKFELPHLPTLAEQKTIASVLGALDDKIESNQRMNETLEEMARAIFKSWFVDFDPVHAKAAGNPPAHMNAETAALFPSTFGDDGLPAGWQLKSLGDFVDIQNGYAFKSKDWAEEGVPVVKIGSVKPSIVDLSNSSFVSTEIAEQKKNFRLKVGDILIGLTGYVGEVGRVPQSRMLPMLNQRVGKIIFKNDIFNPFVYTAMRRSEFKTFAESQAQGSAQANVSTKQIKGFTLVDAQAALIEAFDSSTNTYFEKILLNYAEAKTLAELRDTLLPKLMSGELQIPDAEKFLEKAGV